MAERRAYPSDLGDAEWAIIEPLLPKPQRKGPKENVNLREVVNSIQYWLHEGCQWRAMPHDLPPWQTDSSYFRKWQRQGIWQQVHDTLHQRVREQAGRDPDASAAILDSQSVRTTQKRGRCTATMLPSTSKDASATF